MAFHAPLLRTNTAPVFQQSNDGVARLNKMSIGHAPRASQLSGSTAYVSTTSLATLVNSNGSHISAPPANGQVVATSNIINQKADASRSLYQICVALKQRLALVNGFEGYMEQMAEWEEEGGPDTGPVEGLWKLLRLGLPLLAIYNATDPDEPLNVDTASKATEEKRAKLAIFRFISACSSQLKIPSTDMFIINDLASDDTTGFVKVTIVVNYVLDICQQRGLLKSSNLPYPADDTPMEGAPKLSYRDHIIRELVNTERKYVQDLENLYDLKNVLEHKADLGDIVYRIFLNINAILDFQRRFLIRIETTNSMPESRQDWGSPFVASEAAFNIYNPFIANQRNAAQIASQVFDKIRSVDHPVACDFNTLDGFLLKPMQRLVKYPLLLKDLLKKSDDEAVKENLAAGIASAERVLTHANEAVNQDLLEEAVEDLKGRVDDWKNHKVDQFGKLILHGVNTVVTGKSEQEKDYEIYLFECILLCCKEMAQSKSKDKKDKTKSINSKTRNKNAKLQLKGRIFMTNVSEVLSFSKPGSYTVQIWWKGDPGVENFVIKFQNEETMKKWAACLDRQRKLNGPQNAASATEQPAPNFRWMETQSEIVNPFIEQDDEEEDNYQQGGSTVSRNTSNANLRQRSATNDSTLSLTGMARSGAPPRFPMPQQTPLSLQTSQMGAGSPGPRGGDSYFSPVAESPASSRASAASNFFTNGNGYKNGQPPGWGEEQNRYTAPALPRAPSREGPSPVNAYGMVNGRNPRGPSLPAMASQSVAQQQRSRSYSTPDINGQPQQQPRRTERGGSQGIPAVPGIPQHLHAAHERHDSSIPRSNTGSPRQDLPIRTSTQSPGVQRERVLQSQQSYNGGPTYRTHTPNGSSSLVPAPLNLSSASIDQPIQSSTGSLKTPSSANDLTSPMPTQLKVKVNCDSGNYITLVAPFNITYQSLIDRIDAKLNRFTDSSIGKGNLRLRYRDEDGDFVSIESDEDIQIAFSDWREGMRNMYSGGGMGEIELFCVGEGGRGFV